jgi:hypothetical protein
VEKITVRLGNGRRLHAANPPDEEQKTRLLAAYGDRIGPDGLLYLHALCGAQRFTPVNKVGDGVNDVDCKKCRAALAK